MKQLIPVDGSPASLRAVDLALAQPGRDRLSVVLLSVQPALPRHAARFLSRRTLDEFRAARAQEQLAEARRRLDRAGVRYTCRIATGPMVEAVVDVARAERADEILIGVQRATRWLRALAPGIAESLVDRAPVPVRVIADGEPGVLERFGVPAGVIGLTAFVLSAD